MIYNKKTEPRLTDALFKNPTSEFRGAPFWAWNTKLTDETLIEQIDNFKAMGIGGFHMHVRTGMETAYLSDEFMHFIKLCNEKAKKEQMLCWLYDEDRWPSGAAGGLVTKNNRYRQRFLVLDTRDPRTFRKGFGKDFDDYCRICRENVPSEGYFLCRFGVRLDDEQYLADYRLLADNESYDGDIWYAYVCVSGDSGWYNGQAYLDTMSKEAVQAFVNTTYEAYYRAVGEDFGKSIPAIFTDEPQVPRWNGLNFSDQKSYATIPYTDDFNETYRAVYGESLLEKLPELFWEKRDNGSACVRYRYFDHMCERFVSAFVDTVGSWCEQHGIAFTGHMMNEPTLFSQTVSLGEAMRCYRNFQLPGMDLLCDSVELSTAKQVQSAVHQYGREGMLSELYGVTGWDFPFRGHKRQGDWQAALGVTVRVHHLTWVSMNGDAKHDYPASIGYQSPWYKEYKYIEDHFARLYTALTRGKPVVRVGVIHPIESYWLYAGPNDKTGLKRGYLDRQFSTLVRTLCTSGVDFDFIDESLLPSLCAQGGNPLTVGEMAYDLIVLPEMTTIRSTTLDRLNAFTAAGGKVVLVGSAPALVDAQSSSAAKDASCAWTKLDVDYNALVEELRDVRFLEFTDCARGSRTDNIVHQLRADGDDLWLFFCHANDQTDNNGFVPAFNHDDVRLTVNGAYDVTEYNTLTSEIYTPAYEIKNGKTVVRKLMFNEDSYLFKLTPAADKADRVIAGNAPARPLPKGMDDRALAKPSDKNFISTVNDHAIALTDAVPVRFSEPNTVLLDQARYAFDGEPYTDRFEDSARIGDIGRKRFYEAFQSQTTVQPWVPVPDELKNDPGHVVKRLFRFASDITIRNAELALEMADEAVIWINGVKLDKVFNGWFVDKCIRRVKLPEIPAGEVTVEIETPFTLRGRTEWVYILGDFGVRVAGKYVTVTAAPATLAFGDAVNQGYPFYTGNVTYETGFAEPDGANRVMQISDFGGALLRVKVDGRDLGPVALAPYCLDLGYMAKGEHRVEITVFGTRFNAFGPVHNNVKKYPYWGPNSWRTYDSPAWTDTYHLRPTGILNNPIVY